MSESKLVGRVKWFNTKKGYGFLTIMNDSNDNSGLSNNDDVFVHQSTLVLPENMFRYLVEGEYVEFNLQHHNEKNVTIATSVTGISGGPLMCQHLQRRK